MESPRKTWLDCADDDGKRMLNQYTKKEILRFYRQLLLDCVEADTFIRDEANKVIEIKDDSYITHSSEMIVELLVKEILRLRQCQT